MVDKVIATPAAVELIAFLKTKYGPALMNQWVGSPLRCTASLQTESQAP